MVMSLSCDCLYYNISTIFVPQITLCYLELYVDSLSCSNGGRGGNSGVGLRSKTAASDASDFSSLLNVSECFSSSWSFVTTCPLSLIEEPMEQKATAARGGLVEVKESMGR